MHPGASDCASDCASENRLVLWWEGINNLLPDMPGEIVLSLDGKVATTIILFVANTTEIESLSI